MNTASKITLGVLTTVVGAGLLSAPAAVRGEEIWLYDNSRVYGLVKGVTADKGVNILMPTGEQQKVRLEDIIAIRFLGRNPLLIQSGTQEFRFVNGGTLRGQIQANVGDLVKLHSAMAGLVSIDLARVKGFVALPLAGFSGRKAEELVDSTPEHVARQVFVSERDRGVVKPEHVRMSRAVDVLLDAGAAAYPGVGRKLDRTHLDLDLEQMLQVAEVKVVRVAGFRTADAARDPAQPWEGDVQVRMHARDESIVQGHLARIQLGRWQLLPLWNIKNPLNVELEEISLVQVLGGRVQYLSQLTPVKVEEKTVLAPPQPFRMDRSCQGDPISIAGKRYPWGLGVHANSELTFDLKGRFNEFRADIGVASRMGERGSVIFSVLGDGKEFYKSPVLRGTKGGTPGGEGPQAKPLSVAVPVKGVKMLTLKVTDADDLDLGDVANWGSARVLR